MQYNTPPLQKKKIIIIIILFPNFKTMKSRIK